MAGPVVMENPYHARSTSMPARSHPLSHRIEEELTKLKALAALLLPPASSPSTAEAVAAGLTATADLYDCVDDLLSLPHTQQAIRRLQGEKGVTDLLDASVRLLDVCSTARESLVLIRERAKDVQSALRRRCAGPAIAGAVDAYMRARMDAKKDTARCLKALKHMDHGGHGCAGSPAALDKDANVSMDVRVLQGVKAISVALLQALLALLSAPSWRKSLKPSKWSLVSRAMLRGRQQGGVAELVCSLHRHIPCKDVEVSMVETVQRQLEKLQARLVCLEDALECLFRRLIQNRVSLLNILSV